jgi:predicted nucleotidyltransferase
MSHPVKTKRSRSDTDLTVESIQILLNPIFQKYGIQKSILFGSFARGTQSRKSDIDLILIQDTDKRYFDRFDGILSELQKKIRGRDVEVLIYTPEELVKISHRRFIRDALDQGRVIYEC